MAFPLISLTAAIRSWNCSEFHRMQVQLFLHPAAIIDNGAMSRQSRSREPSEAIEYVTASHFGVPLGSRNLLISAVA